MYILYCVKATFVCILNNITFLYFRINIYIQSYIFNILFVQNIYGGIYEFWRKDKKFKTKLTQEQASNKIGIAISSLRNYENGRLPNTHRFKEKDDIEETFLYLSSFAEYISGILKKIYLVLDILKLN